MVKQVVVYDTETGEISQAVVDAFKAANLTAVSTDEGNTATLGSDNLIFVPAAEGGTAPEGTMVWRGAWEGATAYAVNDVVLYDSVAWVATEASTGSTPTSGKQAPMPPTDLAADAPLVHIATGDAYWAITYYHDQTAYTDDGSGMRSGAWWKITPVESGTLTVTESGLSFQNLSIWKFVEGILTRQAGDSENSVSLAVTAGVTYYILTASAIPQTGNLTITISGVLSYAPTWTPLSGDLAAYYTAAEADALLAGKAPAPTGTPDGSKFLGDDNSWKAVPTPDLSGYATITQTINAQTGAYTLVAADAGKLVQMTLSAAGDLTVPSDVFTAGQRVDLSDRGTARVTVVAGSGMTINPPPGGTLVMEGRYAYASLVFVSATEADLVGLVAGA